MGSKLPFVFCFESLILLITVQGFFDQIMCLYPQALVIIRYLPHSSNFGRDHSC